MSSLSDFDGGEPVYRHTRAQLIEDGHLFDVSKWYQSLVDAAGVAVPVAITVPAMDAALLPVSTADGDAADIRSKELLALGESIDARLRRVLHAYTRAVSMRRSLKGAIVEIAVTVLHAADDWREVDLWFICSRGDAGEPVLTITLPNEPTPPA